MSDHVNKSLEKLEELEEEKRQLLSLFENRDEEGLRLLLSEKERAITHNLLQGKVKLQKALEARDKSYEENREQITKKREEAEASKAERTKLHEEVGALREKFDQSYSAFKDTVAKMEQEAQVRKETVLAYLDGRGISVELDEENSYLDILYEYLQEGSDMPSEALLNHCKVFLKPKLSLSIFLEPFFLYSIQKMNEEAIKDYEKHGYKDIFTDVLSILEKILDMKGILDQMMVEVDGVRTLAEEGAVALGIKDPEGEMKEFDELVEIVKDIKASVLFKLEEIGVEQEEEEDEE